MKIQLFLMREDLYMSHVLSFGPSVTRGFLGSSASHIVLMLADDMACNARNPKPATVFSHKNMELNVYGDDVEVDYRSYEVRCQQAEMLSPSSFCPALTVI